MVGAPAGDGGLFQFRPKRWLGGHKLQLLISGRCSERRLQGAAKLVEVNECSFVTGGAAGLVKPGRWCQRSYSAQRGSVSEARQAPEVKRKKQIFVVLCAFLLRWAWFRQDARFAVKTDAWQLFPIRGSGCFLCRFSDNCQRFLRSKCRVEHSSLLFELIKILSWCFYRLSHCADNCRNARTQERLPRVWLVYHILCSYYNNSHSYYF